MLAAAGGRSTGAGATCACLECRAGATERIRTLRLPRRSTREGARRCVGSGAQAIP